MNNKRKIEIFSAGCPACEETIAMVGNLACSSNDVTVLDINDPAVQNRAKSLGIQSAPAVLVDGKRVNCGCGCMPDEKSLRNSGVGQPLVD